MKVFCHDDTILPETPSDWDELIEEPLSKADVKEFGLAQLEFGFIRQMRSRIVRATQIELDPSDLRKLINIMNEWGNRGWPNEAD
ncbi:hypothetical protein KKA33_01510 [Patescibacteria group bacterium]|nr:hypothetical protein [Patescibacteria group bacterium]